ncbi:MAG: S9 family peptidase [Chloroflexi bacterium]|nr:MAG: S9 family peptidase [Chloroflexota bacterium]
MRYDFARFLNTRNAYGPSFTADGRGITFVSDITGVPQLWSVPAVGGWPDQLTFAADRVTAGHAMHHDNTLVFGMDTGGNEREQLYLLRGGDVLDLTPDPGVMHNFGAISPDDRRLAYTDNRRHPAYFDVYARDLDGASERCVLQQEGSNFVADWSPNGDTLLLSRLTGSLDNQLFLLDISSGDVAHLTPHEGLAVYQAAQFAPDGAVYLLSDQDSEYRRLARFPSGSPDLEWMTADVGDVDALRVSPDGRSVALVHNENGYGRLVIRDVAGSQEREAPGLPRGVITELMWSPDGDTLTFTFTSPADNMNVWTWHLEGDTCRQITWASRGGIPRNTFAVPELVRYQSFDGLEISGFLYMPEVERPPVVVHVHGGPEARAQPLFSPVIQYFVHRGYAVLAPNVRGSTGYGRTFTHLDDVEKRMDSVADLKAAADWLRACGCVGDRIAVMGGSYGGFMVLAALTAYPDEWAAGVDIVGIANFESFLRNTGAYRRAWRIPEYGDPEKDAGLLRSISPINHVDRIRAPLMVIHGDNDPRVPLSEAEQIVQALVARGQPVEFLHVADEGHGIIKLANKLQAYPAVGSFLDRFL